MRKPLSSSGDKERGWGCSFYKVRGEACGVGTHSPDKGHLSVGSSGVGLQISEEEPGATLVPKPLREHKEVDSGS
jgi:hypothetical protein